MIYLDNAATSWPKPAEVITQVNNCLCNYCANPGRSGHSMALESEKMVYECREKVSRMFGTRSAECVIFTHNATHGLNIIIKGIVKEGMHIVTTSMEHNSVLRPLAATGAMYECVPADADGYINSKDIKNALKKDTALIICTLSSNVCGSVQPYREIAEIARNFGIPFLLDASQGAGVIDINMQRDGIDFLVAPGHKGLLGPTGTGILCINCDISLKTIMEGGTGSDSKLVWQPDMLPDRFESGTINVMGIAGLSAGLDYIIQESAKRILNHENELCNHLAQNLLHIPGIRLIGYAPQRQRCGVLSFVVEGKDCISVVSELNFSYNICARGGFHCAYPAHCTLGTAKTGTVRVSFGPFNSAQDVQVLTDALYKIALQNSP